MDPMSLAALITGVLALITTLFSRIESSKCCGMNGFDLEFSHPVVVIDTNHADHRESDHKREH